MKNSYKFILLTLLAFSVACSGMDHSGHDMSGSIDTQGIPEDVFFQSSKETDGGLYTASLESELDSFVLNEIHTWVLTLTDADGDIVSDATVTLDGGMPEHAHGFPTEPTVTNNEDGTYSVDGVKFQMGGWWQFDFTISGSAGSDTVQLNVNVPK